MTPQYSQMHKPLYRVPSMAEIGGLPWNGFSVASTFSGCGGSCLGYRMAGFRVLWASEFIPAAQETYRANHPTSMLDTRDIRTVTAEDILAAIGLEPGELDILDGSPPCASFSTSGKREKAWGMVKAYSDTKQRTDDLFFEYTRLLSGLKPKVFVAENVSGLVKGTAKGYFIEILRALRACGYRVTVRKLDAKWLGVPQSRERMIFVGVREDLEMEPVHPTPLPYLYTVREALPWIVGIKLGGEKDNWSTADRPSPTVVQSDHSTSPTAYLSSGGYVEVDARLEELARSGPVALRAVHDTGGDPSFCQVDFTDRPCPAITVGMRSVNSRHYQVEEIDLSQQAGNAAELAHADITGYAIAEEWEKLAPGQKSERYLNLIRTDPDAPCPTVTAAGGHRGTAAVTHPTQRRKFTIPELRRICGFPDDFILTGTFEQQWERLGRSVPPVMMSHVAAAVRDQILIPLRARGS